jgi:hypothetical protein
VREEDIRLGGFGSVIDVINLGTGMTKSRLEHYEKISVFPIPKSWYS